MPRLTQAIPGFPIDVVSVTSAAARVVDGEGAGQDTIHLFEVVPYEYSGAGYAPGATHVAELVEDVPYHRIKVRNTFYSVMPSGQNLTIMVGPDGFGTILVWQCEA